MTSSTTNLRIDKEIDYEDGIRMKPLDLVPERTSMQWYCAEVERAKFQEVPHRWYQTLHQ